MAVHLIPTLDAMAEVYRLPTTGGADSPRFKAYVELGRAGRPVSGYNPMTSKPALETVERLLELDAERLATGVAAETANRLGLPPGREIELSITVATPGMWTDRIATEVEHVLLARTPNQLLFWTGDDIDADAVRRVATIQTVRATRATPATVWDAVHQEGLAGALATPADARWDDDVAAALEIVGDDTGVSTMAALLLGDDAAIAMGWTPLGLAPDAGRRHAIERSLATPRGR